MNNKIKITKATIKDLDGILALNFDLFKKEYKENDKSLDLNWTYKQGKKYFSAQIKNGFIEIVKSENMIVGYICGGLCKGASYRKKAVYAELENMIIDKRFRRKSLGQKLVTDFLKWCKNKKVNYISVTASANNKTAIKFYQKMGFKDYDLTLEKNINDQRNS